MKVFLHDGRGFLVEPVQDVPLPMPEFGPARRRVIYMPPEPPPEPLNKVEQYALAFMRDFEQRRPGYWQNAPLAVSAAIDLNARLAELAR